MTASSIGYDKVLGWVNARLGGSHLTVVRTLTWMVLCILVAQRVTPAAVARAIPAEGSGSARTRLRRVGRWWQGPQLDLGRITPRLIRAALALLPKGETIVAAMDTTRAGRWEIWKVGLCFAGRTLPVAWAAIPYPWPRGRFRQTTLALLHQLQTAFPAGVSWSFVADRGFPSAQLFAHLRSGQTDWTLRLRLCDRVEVAGVYAMVREHLEAGRIKPGERMAAKIGSGGREQPQTKAWLVVNEVQPAPPKHKCNPGTERERARRGKKREQHLQNKGRKSRPRSEIAKRYANTWVLFTTAPTVAEAVRQYALRMAIEETFRDCHHYWGLRSAAMGMATEGEVCRLVGVVVLAYLLQVELGWRLSQSTLGQKRRAQWTVSNRVSLFWCGRQIFLDAGCDWSDWLAAEWDHLTLAEPVTTVQLAA